MGEDATLGEFLDAAADAAASSEAERGGPDANEAPSEGLSAVEPASTTYRFAPDGEACVACGAVVERRWVQDDDLVCADCKEW